jgi:hypothetical protein
MRTGSDPNAPLNGARPWPKRTGGVSPVGDLLFQITIGHRL